MTFCPYPQTGDGIGLKLHYFDRLLRENMTGMAVCKIPEISPQAASLLVICTATHVTVMLPQEAQLRKVRELGKDQIVDMDKLIVLLLLNNFFFCIVNIQSGLIELTARQKHDPDALVIMANVVSNVTSLHIQQSGKNVY